ncbi:hypothetical protein MN116_000409, partial [Schistosoma mekongi]
LIIVVVCSVIAVILVSVSIALGVIYSRATSNVNGIRTGDTNVSFIQNACDDFYKFACYDWERQNPLSDEIESFTTFDEVQRNIDKYFWEILSNDSNSKDDPKLEEAKVFYKSCINSRSLDSMRLSYYRMIYEHLGEWDLIPSIPQKLNISDGTKKNLNLTDYVLPTLIETGHSLLFSLKVNPATRLIEIAPDLLPVDVSTDSEKVSAFEQEFYETAFLLGVDKSTKKQLKDAFDMMIRLHRKSSAPFDFDRAVTIDGLNSSCPQIQWMDVFKKLQDETGIDYSNTPITLKLGTQLSERCRKYASEAAKFKGVFQTMMIMHFILQQSNYALKPIIPGEHDPSRSSSQLHFDVQCIDRVKDGFKWTLERYYLQSHVNETHKAQAMYIILNTKNVLLDSIPNISWLDPQQKLDLSDKIRSFDIYGLYLDFIRLKESRSTVSDHKMKEDDYYLNEFLIRQVNHMDTLKQALFDYHTSITEEPTFEPVVYYSRRDNGVNLYAGFLEHARNDSRDDLSRNILRVGFTLAHEFMHVISNQRLSGDTTKVRASTQLQNSLFLAVQNKSQCLRDQYVTRGAIGERMWKFGVLDEIIADNVGLNLSFNLYRRLIQKKNPDHVSEGLNATLSSDRDFFLQLAKSFCGHRKGKALMKYEDEDPHVLERHRINGAFSNSKEFAVAYGCAVGSPMHPVHKCTLY